MRYFILLFILFPVITYSQLSYDYEKRFKDSIPQSHNINPAVIRDHIYKGVPQKYKVDIFEKMSFLFASECAKEVSGTLNSGDIYHNMPDLEAYINEILVKVTPEELKGDSVMYAYIMKDGDYNAAMTPSGHMFMNIGLLGEADNEAFIAAIFAHELAHYYMQHSLKFFIASQTGEFDLGLLGPSEKMPNKYSVKQEKQADSLALVWMEKSGFDIQGLLSCFKAMERLERNYLSQSKNDFKMKEYDHPLSEERYNLINDYYQKKQDLTGLKYMVSEEKFKYFKEISKPEILVNYLKDFNYYGCIEKAFKYHIMDPDNPMYVEFLLESIRRTCYMDVGKWKEKFITNHYYDTVAMLDYCTKKKMTNHFFAKFYKDILAMSDEDISKIRASFYWKGEPKFRTYEEAFDFYYRGGRALKSNECILTNALSFTRDKKERNKLLTEYLACDNVRNKEYAKFLLGDSVAHQFPKRKLIVLNDVDAYLKLGKYDFPIFSYGVEETCDISCVLDSVMKEYKNDTSLYMPKLKRKSTREYLLLTELLELSFRTMISKGERADLYVLDPRYAELFYKYNVEEIEFVNCSYNEEAVDKKTVSSYAELMGKSMRSFLQQPMSVRYLDVFITSVRVLNDKKNKTRYYGGSNKLKFKDTGYNQVVEELKLQMGTRDERIMKNDTYQ